MAIPQLRHDPELQLALAVHGLEEVVAPELGLGGLEARKLAERCKKEGIQVDILFLLDPGAMGVFTGKIPDNVRKVVFYQSGTYESSLRDKLPEEFLENPLLTQVEFEDLYRLNHMTLPSHLVRMIRDQIKGDPGGLYGD